MNNSVKKMVFILSLLVWLVPGLVLAETGLVPCTDNCTFNDIFTLIGNIIEFLLVKVAVPLCALVIMWGGIELVRNPSNATAKGKAKEIILAAGVGLLIALASYLIVDTLLTSFSDTSLNQLKL